MRWQRIQRASESDTVHSLVHLGADAHVNAGADAHVHAGAYAHIYIGTNRHS